MPAYQSLKKPVLFSPAPRPPSTARRVCSRGPGPGPRESRSRDEDAAAGRPARGDRVLFLALHSFQNLKFLLAFLEIFSKSRKTNTGSAKFTSYPAEGEGSSSMASRPRPSSVPRPPTSDF